MEMVQNSVQRKLVWVGFLALVTLGVGLLAAPLLPPAIDWRDFFRPATLNLLALHSPYDVPGFPNPPWALIPLIPFALLPPGIDRAFLLLVSLAAMGYTAYRLGAGKYAIIFLLLSAPVMHEVLNGNIDWLAMLGLIMPPWLGLFFILIKPQIALGIAIFWLVEAWRQGGAIKVLKTFLPVTVAGVLSIVVFGPWPLVSVQKVSLWWNASLWPLSLPVGLALMVTALRTRRMEYAMAASPCFAPYILFHSWVIVLMAIVASTPEMIAAVIGLWILVALKASTMN